MSVRDREALAAGHIEMVERIVTMMCRRFPRVEREDLRSFAMEGLIQAIDRWDPDRGVALSSFARSRVFGAIYDGVQQSTRLSRRMTRQIAFYRKADGLLDVPSEGPPPHDRMEASHRLARRLRDVTTAYVAAMALESGLEESACADDPADEQLAKQQYFRRMRRYIDMLPRKQRDAIYLYYIEDQQLMAIAEHLGCKKSWASRLIATGLERIRDSFAAEMKEPGSR